MYDVDDRLRAVAPPGEPFTRIDAIHAGISRWVVDRLVRHGDLERLGHGIYRRPAPPAPDEERWKRLVHDHLARARAALAAHPAHVLSHQTAALACGWPVDLSQLARVHLTAVGVIPESRRRPGLALHHGETVSPEVTRLGDLLLLAPARTAADCLRTMPVPHAVAVVDGAVRAAATTVDEVDRVLRQQHHWRGRPRAAGAIGLVDPRRETWLESYSFARLHGAGVALNSFARLHGAGVALPIPQVEVWNEAGRMVGRVDGLWLPQGVVAECDGEGKYLLPDGGSSRPDGPSAARRVVAERHRERDLLETGLQVARWSTPEIRSNLPQVAQRVIRACQRGDITHFRGRLRHDGEWLERAA